MKNILYIFILFISLSLFSQEKLSIDGLIGIGFNNDITLVDQKMESYHSYTFLVNANYRFPIYNKLFGETGAGIQWYFNSGTIAISEFKTATLRANIPLIIGYPISTKSEISTGVVFSNNRNFDDFDYRDGHFLRTSIALKGSYRINKDLKTIVSLQYDVSTIPDLFLINQPSVQVNIGISYKLI